VFRTERNQNEKFPQENCSYAGIRRPTVAASGLAGAARSLQPLREPNDGRLENFLRCVSDNYRRSHSQLFQDLFVLSFMGEKRGGYFVEFGATNGVDLSNSFLLETKYGWTGIVAEPARRWQSSLQENRSCDIDLRCIWSRSGETLKFSETPAGEFSTITRFRESDFNDRSNAREYEVGTVSLNDLLDFHKAPAEIDYLSIDTEGSEFSILEAFYFSKRRFRAITVEHNFTMPERTKIYDLLTTNGYEQVFAGLTKWDDWYVSR
jgi:FkbM family methyltransferase